MQHDNGEWFLQYHQRHYLTIIGYILARTEGPLGRILGCQPMGVTVSHLHCQSSWTISPLSSPFSLFTPTIYFVTLHFRLYTCFYPKISFTMAPVQDQTLSTTTLNQLSSHWHKYLIIPFAIFGAISLVALIALPVISMANPVEVEPRQDSLCDGIVGSILKMCCSGPLDVSQTEGASRAAACADLPPHSSSPTSSTSSPART